MNEFIELVNLTGQKIVYRVIVEFEFQEKHYIVLQKVNHDVPAEVWRVEYEDDQRSYHWIDDEEEWDAVCSHYEEAFGVAPDVETEEV